MSDEIDVYANPLAKLITAPVFTTPTIELNTRRDPDDVQELTLVGLNIRVRQLEKAFEMHEQECLKCISLQESLNQH